MIKSIQQFQAEGVEKLEKIFVNYSSDLSKVAERVQGVTKSMVELGCSLIAEEWEFYDEVLCKRRDLRKDWEIIRHDPVTKLTSLGEVTYTRTYFKNKETGERSYLLDTFLGFEKNEYLTEDAVARIHSKAKFVLDKYHVHKYIVAATSHLMDSASDARSEIWHAINGKKKKLAEETFDKIIELTESESKQKAVEISKNYILGHWNAIMNGVKNRSDNIHCSAEEIILSAEDVLRSERKNKSELGAIADLPIYSIPYAKIKKIAALKNRIWGL